MVVSRAHPPLLPPLLLLEGALEPATTPGENTLAHQPGTFHNGNRQLDGGTAPSTLLGGTSFGAKDARVLLLACPVTQHRLPLPRAHGLLRRLRTILTA